MEQELLLGELVRQGLTIYPSRPALIWREQELSYLALDGMIDTAAAGLQRLGVRRGDRVALYTHNLPQFVQAYYGLMRLGAIAVPINIHWRGPDLQYLLATAGVKGVLTIAPLWPRIREVRTQLPDLEWTIVINAANAATQPPGTISWEEVAGDLQSASNPVYGLEGRDPALIAFSAGASGAPKPSLLSHFNLLANCEQFADMEQVSLHEPTRTDPISNLLVATEDSEVALLPLPLTNLFSLNTGLNLMLKSGGTAVLMERFDPDAAIEQIERHKCSLIFGSPAIYEAIIKSSRFEPGLFNLTSLKYAFSYGAPLSDEVFQNFYKRTNLPIYNAYGAVEAGPVISCTAAGPRIAPKSIGYPLGVVEAGAVNRQGEFLPPNQGGEIAAQGPNLMLGYFNPANPATPTPPPDGLFYTGDMGQAGPDGNLYMFERKEDMVVVQGRPVAMQQIEQVLLNYQGVREAAALPADDGYGGKQIMSFITLIENATGITEAALQLHCRQNLPPYACPVRILLYESGPDLPRLPDGRVWRRALRAVLEGNAEEPAQPEQ